jgi:hypothetical protein
MSKEIYAELWRVQSMVEGSETVEYDVGSRSTSQVATVTVTDGWYSCNRHGDGTPPCSCIVFVEVIRRDEEPVPPTPYRAVTHG